MDPWGLILTLFFSLAGMMFFSMGKKNTNIIQLVCGVILMVYPYVVSNNILLFLIGAILCGVAWFFKDAG